MNILVVDDEPAVLLLVGRTLQAAGHEVRMCTSGVDALRTFRQDPGEFDFIVTDQTMPTMKGIELLRAIAETRPGMPALIVTGLSDPLETTFPVLRKPFKAADLLACIERRIGSAA